MFLFLKLYLAHLIGDFVLQFEELYRLKTRSVWGHVLHVLCHFLVSIVIAFPYVKFPSFWIWLTGLCIVHFFQDHIKYSLQEKLGEKHRFWLFTVDQIMHLVFVSTILLLPISQDKLGFLDSPTLNFYYMGSEWTVYAIAIVFAIFGSSYFLHAFRRSYLKDSREDHFITSVEMTYNIVERVPLMAIFLLANHWVWIFAVAILKIFRYSSKLLRNEIDFWLGFIFCAAVGLTLRYFFLGGV